MSVSSSTASEFATHEPAADRLEALRRLYEATAPQLLGLCARILGDAGEAQEIALDTYAAAARHAPAGAEGESWVYTVARERAIARRRSRPPQPPVPEIEPEEVIPAAPSVALQRLQAALAELTPLQSSAIRSAYLDGADYLTLATHAATPVGTLKSALRRGLLRLGERLDG